MPPLLMKLVFARIPSTGALRRAAGGQSPDEGRRHPLQRPALADLLDYWDASLAGTGWFAGSEPTLADVMMSFPLEAAGARVGFGQRRHLPAFVERIHARPAFRAALERGGPYAYA